MKTPEEETVSKRTNAVLVNLLFQIAAVDDIF